MVVYLGMKISPISFAKAAHRARNQTNRANAKFAALIFSLKTYTQSLEQI